MKMITDPTRKWEPSWDTDVRRTWARVNPELVAKMTYRCPLPLPSNVIHIKPQEKSNGTA